MRAGGPLCTSETIGLDRNRARRRRLRSRKATGLTQTAGPPDQGPFRKDTIVKISQEQLKKVASTRGAVTPDSALVDEAVIRLTDKDLIQEIARKVADMPDRDEMVASIKARIEAGDYDLSGEDVADAMIRRAIADSVK